MKSILIGLGVLAVVALVGVLLLAAGFSRQIARAEARLTETPPGPVRTDLPAAVQGFAERGLAGARPGAAVRLTQAAEMRLDRGATWTALSARQTIAAAEPGFAWVAEMKIGPIPAVRVIDSYVDGAGRLEIRGLGAVPMGSDTGPEATLGEAQRYLAELPGRRMRFSPTARSPGPSFSTASAPRSRPRAAPLRSGSASMPRAISPRWKPTNARRSSPTAPSPFCPGAAGSRTIPRSAAAGSRSRARSATSTPRATRAIGAGGSPATPWSPSDLHDACA
ncbi:MAG: DUF6544 family protein [Paracoccaceae bacterium]